jgi:hypothetical protein
MTMKRPLLMCGLWLIAIGAGALTSTLSHAESGEPPTTEKTEQEKNVRAALERNKPSEHHKRLEVLAGEWQTEWKVWPVPGRPAADVTKGAATFKWTMEGRFLRGAYTGEMMGGKKFEAELLLGYNPLRRQYEVNWVNSFEVSMARYAGQGKLDGDKLSTLTLTGKQDNCATGQTDVPCRSVFTFVNKDRIVEELYAPDKDGKEYKAVEVTYNRPKK